MFGDGDDVGGGVGDGSVGGCLTAAAAADADLAAHPCAPSDTRHPAGVDHAFELDAAVIGGGSRGAEVGFSCAGGVCGGVEMSKHVGAPSSCLIRICGTPSDSDTAAESEAGAGHGGDAPRDGDDAGRGVGDATIGGCLAVTAAADADPVATPCLSCKIATSSAKSSWLNVSTTGGGAVDPAADGPALSGRAVASAPETTV